MKKKLESELMSVALRILRLEGKDDVSKLHAETALLFEKLSVLKFLQENPQDVQQSDASEVSFFDMIDSAFTKKTEHQIEEDDTISLREDQQQPDEDAEDIAEPVMEKIKDIVAQMPHEANAVDDLFEAITPKPHYEKNDFEDITADFKETPVFEPVTNSTITNAKKSLNDKLKSGGLNIGLNDKIAFIKQLFGGSAEDYERVISQINTSSNFDEAQNLIQNVVKSDYNNWEGKEVFEERFMQIIEGKFN
ncbi:conserved hypothetical protein [Formosa agariphila KMM 3901]|uniref:Uncharacterized protein n=1 Tax=Formosa agariphila (strain DSM 15362 / KCTC 12365 / LMG 23005 / KMM 3901 / M-2Alg 35-1) TaxID=1347342 RepID=T2KG95_FORAG|nr:hypothetical protein [Formosa agariphila]CDF77752.1 conserved hypothetical protein [Formosa agariphila KMM 3901]